MSAAGLTSQGGLVTLMRRHTIFPLILLLILLIAGIELVRPGTVTPTWISNTLLFAAPLGILAAGQTLVMLTGGIDLSVASVATGAAYLLSTNSSSGTPYCSPTEVAIAKLFIRLRKAAPSLCISMKISPSRPSSYSPVWR